MRIAIKTGQWGWSFDELIESWRTAEEAGFDLNLPQARGQLAGFEDAGADRAVLVLDKERGPDWVKRLADNLL